MGSLKTLLSKFIGGLGSRVLASLGIGFISFAGYAAVTNSLISAMQSSWGGITGDVLSYLTLAGFPTGFGIILGCIVTRTSLGALSSLGKLT